jgi:probable addiction module antidote protein
MPRDRPYRIGLNQRLKDPAHAAAYLNAAKRESRGVFLLALRDVVQAHKVRKIAAAAGVNRESLYRALSARGNPSLATLDGILAAIGIEREYRPRIRRKRAIPSSGTARPQFDSEVAATTPFARLSLQALTQTVDVSLGALHQYVSLTGQLTSGNVAPRPANYQPRASVLDLVAEAANSQSAMSKGIHNG